MDPTSREDLSALMDGELDAEPTRFLLRRLDHDPDFEATWSRWHLIRACLASDASRMSVPKLDRDFAARVAAALQVEAEPRVRPRHWARYMGGGAIAAGVAVAALMLNTPNPRNDAQVPVARTRAAPAAVLPTSLAGIAPAANPDPAAPPSWLLSRQPTVLSAQPASADVVYGTGLMQPDYLRRATYAREAAMPFASPFQSGRSSLPFSIVVVPQPPSSGASTQSH